MGKLPNVAKEIGSMDLTEAAEQIRKSGLSIKQAIENSAANMKKLKPWGINIKVVEKGTK